MRNINTQVGKVWICSHAHDRLRRHSITPKYVKELIYKLNNWKPSGHRSVGRIKLDGVKWRIVLEQDSNPRVEHDWDLITVVPEKVYTQEAKACGRWTRQELINLKLYSNQR